MVFPTTCEKCLNNKHTKKEHERERKKKWYEENNYRDTLRVKRRIERGSVDFYYSKYDKKLGRDFNQVLKHENWLESFELPEQKNLEAVRHLFLRKALQTKE